MYTASKEWKELIDGLMDTPFQQINTKLIQDKAEYYTKIVNKCVRSLPSNDLLTDFKTTVLEFKNAMPIVNALRNENLQKSHWADIFAIIDRKIDVDDENFKLKDLIAMNIVEFVDDIKNISV